MEKSVSRGDDKEAMRKGKQHRQKTPKNNYCNGGRTLQAQEEINVFVLNRNASVGSSLDSH